MTIPKKATWVHIPKIPAWVRLAAVLGAAAVVLELLLAIWLQWGRAAPIQLIIAVAVAFASPLAYGIWWLWWRLPKWQVYRLARKIRDRKALADVEDNFRKTVGQALASCVVLIGAGFALFQFLQQQQAAHDLLISNQVSKGFEQLAGAKTEMRLGGVYALEGVMNNSEQYYQPVIDALCAFVRENSGGNAEKTATDVQAALTVIGRRVPGPGVVGKVNLAKVSTPDANLSHAYLSLADLRLANLSRANLSEAILRSAKLSEANLSGSDLSYAELGVADLHNADLSDANLTGARLDYANLSRANLSRANLRGAWLSEANLSGADLRGANVSNGADLDKANLSDADLSDTDLSVAFLLGANLSRAKLTKANLTGAKGLRQEQLDSACGDADTKLPEGLTIKPCLISNSG